MPHRIASRNASKGVLAIAEPMDKPCNFEKYGATTFVGAVQVNAAPSAPPAPPPVPTRKTGVGGVVAMDFARSNTVKSSTGSGGAVLKARRAWFLLDSGFISLTANITYSGHSSAITVALEQNNLLGDATAGTWQRSTAAAAGAAATAFSTGSVGGAGAAGEEGVLPTGTSSWPVTTPHNHFVFR